MVLLNLRERNAASGGEEMLRLRVYEKLQGLVGRGAVNRTITGTTKKYKGVAPRMRGRKEEMKRLRADWAKKLRAKAAARRSLPVRSDYRAAMSVARTQQHTPLQTEARYKPQLRWSQAR